MKRDRLEDVDFAVSRDLIDTWMRLEKRHSGRIDNKTDPVSSTSSTSSTGRNTERDQVKRRDIFRSVYDIHGFAE